nr:hypothetical protein [Tanacetum cinerariifolium]
MIRLRTEAASTSHSPPLPPPFIFSSRSDAPSSVIPSPLPISDPTSSPPLQLPSASHREDKPKVTLPPRKRLGIALGHGYEVGESSSAAAARPTGGLKADYGFVATIDREIRRDPQREVGYEITDSWDEIVETLQGAPSERQLLAGRLNMLFRDRRAHAYTRHQMETEARRQIMTLKMPRADHRRSAKIRGLRTADRTRQQLLKQTLIVMQSLQRQGQQGPAGGPTQPKLPEEAGSRSLIRSCYG